MRPDEARRLFSLARVARLATVGADGHPHVVPIVFAVEADVVFSAVDYKPKRTTRLRRLANIAENPALTVLADYYDDSDWGQLWWARADGDGRLLVPGSEEEDRAISQLRGRYAQYAARPPAGPVLAVDVRRWSGWAAGQGGAAGQSGPAP